MRRIFDFAKRAVQRVNVRIAILIVVVAAGGVAVWQGYSRLSRKRPEGPTKEIATGAPGAGEPSLDPTLDPTQRSTTVKPSSQGFNPGEGGQYQLAGYGQESAAPPVQSNPYLPADDDPAGSPSTSVYAPSSSPPADPTAGAATVPANPYRTTEPSGGAGHGSLTDSSDNLYLADRGQEAGVSKPSASAPAANSAEAYADQLGGNATEDHAPAEVAPVEPAPLASAPVAESPAEMPSQPYGLSGRRASAGALATAAPVAGAAVATPGERQLEGPQQPAIAIEKFSPAEIQVGKPAVFEMLVRNTGPVPAQSVMVTDHVPAGTQLVDVKPQPQQAPDGSLVWNLGTMQPGDEVAITLQVMPQLEGEIGSTAHVTFAATATSRSICTRPQLAIEHTAPPKVLIGESIMVGITVSNPGTGPATGVIIEEDVPEGLAHVAGAQLEYEVGTLRPGESKRLELSLKADKAGLIQNTIHVRGDGNLANQHSVQIEVVAPQLAVEVDGPRRRFLERQATYTLSVANPGTAPARDVELAAFLPRGMKFVQSDSQGQYDPAQHAVFWSLEELPPSKAGAVKLTTLPIEPGEQRLRIEGRAGLGLAAEGEQVIQVEQSAELVHSVNDLEEVIEVGSETTYEVHVKNTGTKAATNVRITALVPAEMQALGGEGPTRAAGDAQRVIFEPLARLNPQEEVVFKVQVQGLRPGDHLVRVQLSSDEWPTPVTREESTRVYEDR